MAGKVTLSSTNMSTAEALEIINNIDLIDKKKNDKMENVSLLPLQNIAQACDKPDLSIEGINQKGCQTLFTNFKTLLQIGKVIDAKPLKEVDQNPAYFWLNIFSVTNFVNFIKKPSLGTEKSIKEILRDLNYSEMNQAAQQHFSISQWNQIPANFQGALELLRSNGITLE